MKQRISGRLAAAERKVPALPAEVVLQVVYHNGLTGETTAGATETVLKHGRRRIVVRGLCERGEAKPTA